MADGVNETGHMETMLKGYAAMSTHDFATEEFKAVDLETRAWSWTSPKTNRLILESQEKQNTTKTMKKVSANPNLQANRRPQKSSGSSESFRKGFIRVMKNSIYTNHQ